jgi:hypothetical protein
MSLVLGVEILGEYKNLTAATKGAQSQLTAMNKRAAKVSSSINKAFAAIGIGLSFRVLQRELEDASKAAIEDSKSQQILALAMQNTANATAAQVAQAEKSINKMQFQAGIADDQLRPAFQKLFIATKDVTESNRLLQIALDASAATGKGLDVVTQAMAKSLAGSDTALVKLIPSLKGAKDPIAELEKAFAGASDAAAKTDPYMRMQVLFGEMQEQIGMALLPVLEELSTWLATPEGQEKLGKLVEWAKDVVTGFANIGKWVVDNKDWLVPMVVSIGAVTAAWKIAMAAVEAYRIAAIAAQALAGPAGWATLGAGALALGIGATASGQGKTTSGQEFVSSFGNVKTDTGKTTVVQNINIKGTQSAAQIAQTLNKQLKASGSSTVIRGGR